MLTSTFCHIPRVGPATEARLWNAGILSWKDALMPHHRPLLTHVNPNAELFLRQSLDALYNRDPHYFAHLLPSHELWRLFPEFRHTIAYLDIETTGLSGANDHVTTITLYDGSLINFYIYGHNLQQFLTDIRRFDVLVTFNGKRFDIPYLERFFGVKFSHLQIDLRYVLAALGYRGGLKACERALGLHRGELDGLDGYAAVLLWHEYATSGRLAALETLLAYNITDTINLETLMVTAYNLALKSTPFHPQRALPLPEPPRCPFTPDPPTLSRIKNKLASC